MADKKKKGDLGDIVFPEFPPLKSKEKQPPLELPKFSKDSKKPIEKKLDLPELKVPSFLSNKEEKHEANPKPVKDAMIPEFHPVEKSKFAPPHEKIEAKKPSPIVRQPVEKEVPVKLPKQQPPVKMPRQPAFKPKLAVKKHVKHFESKQSLLSKIPSLAVKAEMPKHIAMPRPKPEAKPKLAFKPIKEIKIHPAKHKIAAKHHPVHHAKPKVHHPKHIAHHPKHHRIKIKHHKAPRIPKVHHPKLTHYKAKPIYRALSHVTVKGPVKPKEKLTVKRLTHHMSDLAKELAHYRSEALKQESFKNLKSAVEKEVSSIKKIYREFDEVQRDFKKTQLAFQKSKKELDHEVAKSKHNLKEQFEQAKKAMSNEVDSAKKSMASEMLLAKKSMLHGMDSTKKSFSKHTQSTETFTNKQIGIVKNQVANELVSFRKSMIAKQDEVLKRVNAKLAKMESDNLELTKDLGKLSLVDSKLSSKLDINIYNQLVRKINELETNTAANENQLDNDLRATIAYVKKLADRIIYHEKLMQQLSHTVKNKPKLDFNDYIEEYAQEKSQPEYEESYPQEESIEEEATEVEEMLSNEEQETL